MIILILAVAMGGGLLVVVLSLIAQAFVHAKAVTRQKQATERVEESLDLSRRSIEQVERLLQLTEQSLRNQEEMIRLLRQAAGPESWHAEGKSAIQALSPPQSGPRPRAAETGGAAVGGG
jgi:hypothetical protein